MTLTINIIGAGRLGKTLGRLIVQNNLGTLGGVHNQSEESTVKATQWIGAGLACPKLSMLPGADITLLTVPDSHISSVCIELCRAKVIQPGSILVHCSGALTSDVLSAAKLHHIHTASIHPMKSFASPAASLETYAGTFCAVEGELEAVTKISELFCGFGSTVYPISKAHKMLYHAGGVFASNYLVTLTEKATCCLVQAGIDKTNALHIIVQLMRGTLDNIEAKGAPNEALTGPIARADVSTIKGHLSAFLDDELKLLYATLGKATVSLTAHDNPIKEKILSSLVPHLHGYNDLTEAI